MINDSIAFLFEVHYHDIYHNCRDWFCLLGIDYIFIDFVHTFNCFPHICIFSFNLYFFCQYLLTLIIRMKKIDCRTAFFDCLIFLNMNCLNFFFCLYFGLFLKVFYHNFIFCYRSLKLNYFLMNSFDKSSCFLNCFDRVDLLGYYFFCCSFLLMMNCLNVNYCKVIFLFQLTLILNCFIIFYYMCSEFSMR
jgi:hypothetical protein